MTGLRRAAAGLALTLALVACGGAATGPADDFRVDPSPVVGDWYTVSTSVVTPDQTFVARIEAGQGFLAGEFVFEVSSQLIVIPFTDGRWDGSRIRFFTSDLFGGSTGSIEWTALLVPSEAGTPTRLRLFPRVGGGVPISVTYVRLHDLDFLR